MIDHVVVAVKTFTGVHGTCCVVQLRQVYHVGGGVPMAAIGNPEVPEAVTTIHVPFADADRYLDAMRTSTIVQVEHHIGTKKVGA
jgi:hypothetical protein